MSAKIMEYIKNNYKLILPFFLSVILSSALFSVYEINVISKWTLFIIAVNIFMFAFCGFVNRHHFIGGTVLTVMILVLLSCFVRLIMGRDYGESFQRWFLTGAEQVNTQNNYLIALLISFTPFFASVIFYFTNVLYRMSFLTLLSLIPCAVYVKVLSEIDNVYVALIAILNISILMIELRTKQASDKRMVGSQAAVLSSAVFISAVLIISSVIPKQEDAVYYDRFEELFMDGSSSMTADFSKFSNFSGGADSFRNLSNRRLYTVYGSAAPYFKRQTFDSYDFDENHWYPTAYYSDTNYSLSEWQEKTAGLNNAMLQQAVKAADRYEPGFAEKYGLEQIASYKELSDSLRTISVQSENFGAVYYLSPARCISITPVGETGQIYATRSGVFRSSGQPHYPGLAYQINYFDEYESRFFWQELGGADFDNDSCRTMLEELETVLRDNGDALADTAAAFGEVNSEAEVYRRISESNSEHISDKIRQLAEEITSDCTYDWEKANILQNYFIKNDYIYDIDYIAERPGTEYFLFESKRGSCSDFATAFTLMARSIGLTVRYCEGYSPNLTSRENVFIINENCSHAYPEVYIQNMGWLVYEPTVPSPYSNITDLISDNAAFNVDYGLIYVICIIAGIILAAILLSIIFFPFISEKIFYSKVRKADPDRTVILIYGHILKKVSSKLIKNAGSLTPYELAVKLCELTECDISRFVFIAEGVIYGGMKADNNHKLAAEECYDQFKHFIRKYENNRRKERKNRNEK